MRLQRPIHTHGRVQRLTIRAEVNNLPDGANVELTDLQVQPGRHLSGVTVNPREHGSRRGGRQYRNGVVHDGLEVVILANLDEPTPTRLEVHNAAGHTRIGSYRFGRVHGFGYADAIEHHASHGYGRPPVITPRADLPLRVESEGRVHARITWADRETP